MKLYIIKFVAFSIVSFTMVNAQGLNEKAQQVKVGHSLPPFKINKISYHRNGKLTPKDFLGKHTILCFWNHHCSGAYGNLIKMNEIRQKYKGELEIIMIGGVGSTRKHKDKEEMDTLRALFKRARKMKGIDLPVLYDPGLFRQFVPRGVPHMIWIDGKGVIKAATWDIDTTQVREFLNNKDFIYTDASYDGIIRRRNRSDTYNRKKLFLSENNGGVDTVTSYRSLIAPYTDEMPKGGILTRKMDRYKDYGKIEGVAPLINMFKLAYFGYYWNYTDWEFEENYNRLILEIKNKERFENFSYDRPRNNVFWYSLIVPRHLRSSEALMKVMQQDLKNFFGYDATVEKRKLPYWRITIDKAGKRKLRTKGGERKIFTDQFTYLGVTNVPLKRYLQILFVKFAPTSTKEFPVIDETGIDFKIDTKTSLVDMLDFEDIKRLLKKDGFTIERTEKYFNVLVLREASRGSKSINTY